MASQSIILLFSCAGIIKFIFIWSVMEWKQLLGVEFGLIHARLHAGLLSATVTHPFLPVWFVFLESMFLRPSFSPGIMHRRCLEMGMENDFALGGG